jgi:hypothetical protein
MSLWRWDHSEKMIGLGWPPAVRLNKLYKCRSRRQLEVFKQNMVRLAITERDRMLEAAE